MQDYGGALALLVLGIGLVAGAFLVHRLVSVAPVPVTAAPFLSGYAPAEHALSRYHVRWYAMTLLFLAFDIEMLFMYPWAVVVAEIGAAAVIEMFGFLAILMIGVLYAWREGALRWT